MKYDKNELLGMYRTMVKSRMFEDEMNRQLAKGRIGGLLHFTIGQEAIGAAIAYAMHEDEPFLCSHRCKTLILHRVDLYKYMSEIWGTKNGYCSGLSAEMHVNVPELGYLANPGLLGEATASSVGYAYALKLLHPGRAFVHTMGDGTFSQGAVHEAMNWAGIQKLPLVIVVENNHWQSYTPPEYYRPYDNILDRAKACALETISVYGNDVVAMREAMDIALTRAREECIPTVIEAMTFRVRGHHSGDRAHYRSKEYVREMTEKYPDPIPLYEKQLTEGGIAEEEELSAIKREIKAAIAECADRVWAEKQDPALQPKAEDVEDINLYYASVMDGLR